MRESRNWVKTIAQLITVCLLCHTVSAAPSSNAELTITVSVVDSDGRPVPGVFVQARSHAGGPVLASGETNVEGKVSLVVIDPHAYEISISREGMEKVTRGVDLSSGLPAAIGITMTPMARRDSVDVNGTADPVAQGATSPQSVNGALAKQLPNRPSTVSDALPLIPGVVREPGGALLISASSEHRSALIVNSADVTDPATGQFGLTVPIDSVEALNVYQTPYLAQYGRFTGGIVSVETRRGGDTWKWELNDPLPEFRIRSYQLRGLKDATPRLNFEGPIVPGKFFLSEGFEYEVRRTAVYTLPFPHNQKKTEGINSFSQIDWVASPTQLLTATVHAAPQRLGFANMDYFNPEQTAPDASTHNYTGTLADHLELHGGLLDSVFSVTHFDAGVWGQGSEDLVITPGGNRGNY